MAAPLGASLGVLHPRLCQESNLETKGSQVATVYLSGNHCCVASGPSDGLIPGSLYLLLEAFLILFETLKNTVPWPTFWQRANVLGFRVICPWIFPWAGCVTTTNESIIWCPLEIMFFKESFIIYLEGRHRIYKEAREGDWWWPSTSPLWSALAPNIHMMLSKALSCPWLDTSEFSGNTEFAGFWRSQVPSEVAYQKFFPTTYSLPEKTSDKCNFSI